MKKMNVKPNVKPRKKRPLQDKEIARAAIIIKRLPIEIAFEVSSRQLIRAYDIKLSRGTVDPIREQILEERRQRQTGEGSTFEDHDLSAQAMLELLARIITKTYAHKGDEEEISAEDALRLMHRVIKKTDPAILKRNEKRRIPNVPPATPLAERLGGN